METLISGFKEFLLVFVPLFVALDSIGTLPIYVSLTTGLKKPVLKTLLRYAMMTAFVVSLVFVFGGQALFSFLGITSDDFRIGGGLVLLIIAISDLLFSQQEKRRSPDHEIGIVPMGVPLIMGPAALTTLVMQVTHYGHTLTLISLIVNLGLIYLLFSNANHITRVLGKGGTQIFGKISAFLLLAIAVMMIRVGLTNQFPFLMKP